MAQAVSTGAHPSTADAITVAVQPSRVVKPSSGTMSPLTRCAIPGNPGSEPLTISTQLRPKRLTMLSGIALFPDASNPREP
jgi:hypothetical protein